VPSLVKYRSVVGAELFRNPGYDRRMDFGRFWKAPVRPEEKQ
jgi:hypothetical protein